MSNPPLPTRTGAPIAEKLRALRTPGDFTFFPRGQDAKSRRNAIYTTARRLHIPITIGPCPASVTLDHERYLGVWRTR